MSLLIRPQQKYLIKTGFKFLCIPLLIALSVGLFGFQSENSSFKNNTSLAFSPFSFNGLSLPHKAENASSGKVKQFSLFSNNNSPIIDTTRKAKADTTKKTAVDTTKKKSSEKELAAAALKADSLKKTTVDTVKNKVQDKNITIPVVPQTDTTKKKAAEKDLAAALKADTTKKTLIDTTKKAVQGKDTGALKADPVQKAAADTTKKKVLDKSIVPPANAKTDTTKKSEADKNAGLVIKTVADTTKRDTISPDTRYLLHISKFTPYIDLNQKYVSGFYDPFQNKIQRSIKLDSTGTKVIITETIAGQKIKPQFVIPVEEYLKIRSKGWAKEAWEKPYRAYDKKEVKKDLQKLMSDFTKVEIPLPSVGLLSIFGEPKIQLEVNGSVKVHAGWRNETTEGYTLALQGNSRNEPDFSQEIQIGLNGKIGDKLTIGADWGTKRNFQYENILKIKYTGYDDEIVQSVEAGNVSMQTSSLIGGSEALFGIKANFQFGPLKLQALASQKRSQSEQKTVNSGSQVTKFTKRAWEYSTNHFFIDEEYTKNDLYKNYYSTATPTVNLDLSVKEIEVWKTTTGIIQQGKERRANAYLDLDALPAGETRYDDSKKYRDSLRQSDAGMVVGNQRFVKLEETTDYTFNKDLGVISFKTLINESEAVAVAFKSPRGNYGEMIATTDNSNAIMVLKLVKPPNLQPSFTKAWKLMLKNIYPLGGKGIKKEGFKFNIKYQVEGQELQDNINGKKLLALFGLDKYDLGGGLNPDNEFDFNFGVSIIPETGEVIFPMLHPFNEDIPNEISEGKYKFDSLYTNTQTMARLQTLKDKFVLTGEYSAASTTTMQIFNAVENSIKVTLDGVELKAGSDFTVEYMGPIAELKVLNPRALLAGANLVINYEQNDMVNLASKTLLGVRGLFDINKDTRFGFTAMNLNQQTLSDKVTIGQEPLSNTMYGFDFSGSYDIPFLTKIINTIIPTNETSKLIVTGEFAYVNPDPNTKKSNISTDESKSIAYIDDFEGSRKIIPIGSNYGGWHDLSYPRGIFINGNDSINFSKMPYKAKMNWYNDVRPSANVTVEHLYGEAKMKQTSKEDQRVTAMDFWYQPKDRGYYNRHPKLPDPENNWGGIMRSLSSTANNLIEENIQYIEFWMKITNAPKGAKLYVDLGQISEDVIPNGALDFEDRNKNDAYDAGEDIGMDFKSNTDEKNDTSLEGENDPSDDDYDATSSDYAKINGTEGNAVSTDLGRLPDSEDLNRNWTLDKLDNFFRYEMPIDTSSLVNNFIQGGKAGKGWFLVRIPLNKYNSQIGKPDLRITETIRFFVHGAESDVHLRFAEINLVGNQWRKLAPSKDISPETDEVLLVQTISIDDNKEYTAPPGLQQEIDRTKTDKTVLKNEQSLNLVLNNLQPGDKREIIKDYSRGLDVFNYKEMKMYVHGDELPSVTSLSFGKRGATVTSDSIYNAQLYFRFGADTTNFYEYRMPVEPGWKDMRVIFEKLTALKQVRTKTDTLWQIPIIDKPGHYYGIRGTPSLTGIKFFIVGIMNPKIEGKTNRPVSGSVWINELRVLDADNTPGWSYMSSASFKLADILLVNFTMQNKNPYFHRIADRFGNRTDEKSWSLSTEVDLMKFIPFDLPGSNLRFTYTKSESVNKPLYLFNTDIKVSEAAAKLEQQLIASGKYSLDQIKAKVDSLNTVSYTTTVSETYSLPIIAIRAPVDNWFNRDVINGFTFGFNYNKQTGKSPSAEDSHSWQWDANARYQLDLTKKGWFLTIADIPILGEAVKWSTDYNGMRLHYFPQTFGVAVSARRQYKYDLSRNTGVITSATQAMKPSISRDFITTRSMEFLWMMTENAFFNITAHYTLDIASSNAHLLADSIKGLSIDRDEKAIWRDILRNGFFGKDYAVLQRVDLKANPKLPAIWDLNRYFTMSFSYLSNYTWKNDFQQKELGRSALYESTFRFTTTLRWKSLTAPLFASEAGYSNQINVPRENNGETRRGRGRGEREGEGVGEGDIPKTDRPPVVKRDDENPNPPIKDSLALKNKGLELAKQDSSAAKGLPVREKQSAVSAILGSIKGLFRFALFDYDKIDLNFEIINSYGGGALKGEGNGFNNFWGFSQSADKGPSRLFMLGFSNDLGPRVAKANTNITDNFSQKNKIEFKTTRPLWEGAELSLIWTVNWGMNKSTQMKVEDDGQLTVTNINATGTIERSFVTIPPVLMFSTIFNNGIKKVNELYSASSDKNLSDAFVRGFEAFPLLSKVPFFKDLMKYIPRPNWSFTWSGLEKFPVFNLAKRASLTHMYTSNYREGWKIDSDGKTEIQQQSIDFSFAPLIGLNLSFEQILGGTLNTSIKYNTKSIYTYSAGTATQNITLGLQNDMDFTASFLKAGFEIPLFGLALKNDIEFSISFSSGRTSNVIYNMSGYFKEEGDPVDGTIRTKISPRVKYNMSQKVNISVYYERTSVKPEGASRTPPITTNLAGLDVEIRIGN